MSVENKEFKPLLKEEEVPVKNGEATDEKGSEKIGPAMLKRMKSSMKTSQVFFKDRKHGWLPGHLVDTDEEKGIATIVYSDPTGESEDEERKVNLKHYGSSKALPMQCVDSHGTTVVVEDMRDLPYSNEASILYNLKERYEKKGTPYTRATNSVMVAINPYEWIDGLYSERVRQEYADEIVWKASQRGLALPPHIYEISSMAMRGILADGTDQTIVVSGESGSGKTVSSKILMAHLATFHEKKRAYVSQKSFIEHEKEVEEDLIDENETKSKKKKVGQGGKKCFNLGSYKARSPPADDLPPMINEIPSLEIVRSASTDISQNGYKLSTPQRPQPTTPQSNPTEETNLIVQRVIDSNPLLEAFGNAKTCLNDNSSRFSRYSTLQFHVEDGVAHPTANIAGSTCHTFLLEKSRVVSHDVNNDERTFHIFYQLMKAPEEEKEKIWKGLKGKCAESFKYIGGGDGSDEFTNGKAWKQTISALNTIGVDGSELQTLLMAVCIVLQLGNITFIPNPENEEEAVISNEEELHILSEMIGIPSSELSHCLTHKTMNAVHDTYQVPLKLDDAKSTCDAFAKECYRALFDWLVSKTNESTCADRNYKEAHRVSRYSCISVLDICGFECFETNGFEQLLINHANERLQKTFTETMIDAVMEEYKEEKIIVDNIEHEDNETVIRFFEGKMGLIPLLNEECIRPQGSDAGFVNKVYATHSTTSKSSKLVFQRNYQLSKTLFGIRHFAKDVTYDATGFLMKNKDTLPFDAFSLLDNKTMTTNRDTCQVPLKVGASKSSCDALAKECYLALFDWLVNATNESTCADTNYKRAHRVSRYSCISVLDICGFECFETNGFEQLLINHANERLQKTFTETMIDAVMEEYEFEGIPMETIEHEDNETVIQFFEGKMGLMSLLNEECILPRSSDASFVKKIYATHDKNLPSSKLFFEKNFQLAKHSKTLFGIRHFAKDVTYDATGFLMKNKDTLPFDVLSCAVKSTNHIIRAGIQPNQSFKSKKKSALVGTSLWSSFERQMTTLFTQIKRTRVWFVRCIIPNNNKQPFSLDLKCTLTQLRSVGLLTALKMSHASFPNKQAFDHILRRFWFLGSFGDKYAFGKVDGREEEIREDCEKLLCSVLSDGKGGEGSVGEGGDHMSLYETGRTKVYFREGSLEELESERAKAFDKSASKIQARVRGIKARKDFKKLRAQLVIQKQEAIERKKLSIYLIPFAILPLFLLRYMFGSVRRP
eukprot:CAMPEP_0203684068 /NCGR_PEP_ID=MMETSP0090-20130426/47847_1 /ASSEMBLY_ACC=CAM_ASM_001088 /TAXON_ID=426623 /ORGANISM="Chaetoceros affinis, Strain CCMP159" /LENGTH=1230 /DNA_ID=CAMNT_0050553231 /DNA_START=174 /DNA_END=3864 /DNA_ORIENTATION=+